MNNQISDITFTTDSVEGNKLTVSVPNTGWVEYAKSQCRIYVSKSFPEDLYNDTKNLFVKGINQSWPDWPNNFGFVNHLAGILQNENFIMPAFGEVTKNGIFITCGNSRFSAHSCSGKSPSTFGLVLLAQKEFSHPSFTEIETTEQFNNFYNLNEIDYRIGLTLENSKFKVLTSILRHTFYNVNDPLEDKTIALYQRDIENFWSRYLNPDTNKLGIQIHCLPEHRKYINQSSVFQIKFIDEEPGWGFSHGRLLGAFRRDEKGTTGSQNKELIMWLFDISEPFDLELMLPLMKFGTTCIYTENKKAVMFDQSSYSDFKIIGNIVK